MCINPSYYLVCSLFVFQDTRLCHGASKAPRTVCICVVLRNPLCLLALLMSLKDGPHSLKNECSICLEKGYKNWFERPQARHHGADFSTQDPRAFQYASILFWSRCSSEGELGLLCVLQGLWTLGTSNKKEPIQGAQVLHQGQDCTAAQPVDALVWPGKAWSDNTSRYVLHNLHLLLKYLD